MNAIFFVAGDVTKRLFFPSNEGSQITLSFAGSKAVDSLPRGKDKRKIDSYENDETDRRSADLLSVAGSRRHRRQQQQGNAASRRDRHSRRQTAPGRQVSSGMDWNRTGS